MTSPAKIWVSGAIAALGLSMMTGCRDAVAPESPTRVQRPVDAASPSNLWRFVPSLSSARTLMGVALVGKCAWSIGGLDPWPSASATSTVESVCQGSPPPTQWSPKPSLPEPLGNFAGVAAIGSKIYVAGGTPGDGNMRNTMYIYDPATGWRLDPEPMPLAMACGAAAVFSGRLYVYGQGVEVDTAEKYHPYCDTVTRNTFAVYDPSLAAPPRWRLLAAPPYNGYHRLNPGMATIGRNLYLVGNYYLGSIGSSDVHVFDATLERWFTDAERPPNFRWGRGRLAVVAAQGRIYALGGFNGNLSFIPGHVVSVYSPSLNTWDDVRPLQDFRDGLGAVAAGDKIVAIGGGTNTVEWITLGTGPSACDVYEPDDVAQKATPWDVLDYNQATQPVLLGISVTQAQLCSATDEDWFALRTSGGIGNTVKVQLTMPPGTDYELELWDLSGTVLLDRSALPGNAPELVTYVGPFSPDRLLRVRSQDGTFSNTPYRLEVVP